MKVRELPTTGSKSDSGANCQQAAPDSDHGKDQDRRDFTREFHNLHNAPGMNTQHIGHQ
jgi:hypothetical protein